MKRRLLATMVACLIFMGLLSGSAMAAANDQQIVFGGASVPETGTNEDGVSLSKILTGTENENYFDITLQVKTTTLLEELVESQTTDVVIVLDCSATMSQNNRLVNAKAAACAFVDSFCSAAGLGKQRELGLVTFNTNATTVFPLETANAEKQAQWKAAINNITTPGSADSTRFTNIEAGLKLASNLLANSFAQNKFIVLVTDGFPTTWIKGDSNGTSAIQGYIPYPVGSYNGDGQHYDAVKNAPLWGCSYSDTGAARAQAMAAAIKQSINIFTVGIDIGGQTIQEFIDTDVGAYSIVERTSENYVIGGTEDSAAYVSWLANAISGGPKANLVNYSDGSSLPALQNAYNSILAEIKRINMQSIENTWIASDPMSQYVEFRHFYGQNGTALALTGSRTAGGENTASFDPATNTINWNLLNSGYTVSSHVEGGATVTEYVYSLRYQVRLKNEMAGFIAAPNPYATNGAASLRYKVLANDQLSAEKSVLFPVPKAQGYLGTLAFYKIDSHDRHLAGATFVLEHGADCEICHGAIYIPGQTQVSNLSGAVVFSGLPSAHTYTMRETIAPEGFELLDTFWKVVVKYGETSMYNDQGGQVWAIRNGRIPIPSETPYPVPTFTPTPVPSPTPMVSPDPSENIDEDEVPLKDPDLEEIDDDDVPLTADEPNIVLFFVLLLPVILGTAVVIARRKSR
jgi:hypothetical protein